VRTQHDVKPSSATPHGIISQSTLQLTFRPAVRRIIEARLGGQAARDEIAAGIGMSRQTLRRRLRDENTSVTDIKDDVLREAAIGQPGQGHRNHPALSQRLGFSEPAPSPAPSAAGPANHHH